MKLIFAIIYFNQTTICRARLSPNQKKKKNRNTNLKYYPWMYDLCIQVFLTPKVLKLSNYL